MSEKEPRQIPLPYPVGPNTIPSEQKPLPFPNTPSKPKPNIPSSMVKYSPDEIEVLFQKDPDGHYWNN